MDRRDIFRQEMLTCGERFADTFSLPKDAVVNATLLHMIGRTELLVENFKGLISYDSSEIVIKGSGMKFKVCGERLMIEHYCGEDMKISGRISGVTVISD